MKYIFIFYLCLAIEPLFAQIYVGGSFGAGIAQTSQVSFKVKAEEKTINTFTHNIKFTLGYAFKKKKIGIETGVGLTKYSNVFHYDNSHYKEVGRITSFSFIPFAIPLTLKCKLDIPKSKKTDYYAKIGAIHYTYADVFSKDKLKSPSAFINNNKKIEVKYYYASGTLPGAFNTFLINFGLEANRRQFKKGYLTYGLEIVTGLHTLANAYIRVQEKQNKILVNDDLFVIDIDGSCQFLYVGYIF